MRNIEPRVRHCYICAWIIMMPIEESRKYKIATSSSIHKNPFHFSFYFFCFFFCILSECLRFANYVQIRFMNKSNKYLQATNILPLNLCEHWIQQYFFFHNNVRLRIKMTMIQLISNIIIFFFLRTGNGGYECINGYHFIAKTKCSVTFELWLFGIVEWLKQFVLSTIGL